MKPLCPKCGRPMVPAVQSKRVDDGKSPAMNTPILICSGFAYLESCNFTQPQDAPRQGFLLPPTGMQPVLLEEK